MTTTPATPPPDDKDWTWVLSAPCPECGFDATQWDLPGLADLCRATVPGYRAALARTDARTRPAPTVWSSSEYGAHVRDVHRIFAERMAWVLREDTPTFANWDQDATAAEQRYDLQDPAVIADELADAAEQVAVLYADIAPESWGRRGLRSNGSAFTVLTLARYHLHDVVHHLVDVENTPEKKPEN